MEKENVLYAVYTATEAARNWGLNDSTIRKAISQKIKFVKEIDYRKAGGVTLITREAMEREYGEMKES